jgi:hypothetical protein
VHQGKWTIPSGLIVHRRLSVGETVAQAGRTYHTFVTKTSNNNHTELSTSICILLLSEPWGLEMVLS